MIFVCFFRGNVSCGKAFFFEYQDGTTDLGMQFFRRNFKHQFVWFIMLSRLAEPISMGHDLWCPKS